MTLVQLGDHYVNKDNITVVSAKGNKVQISFLDGGVSNLLDIPGMSVEEVVERLNSPEKRQEQSFAAKF